MIGRVALIVAALVSPAHAGEAALEIRAETGTIALSPEAVKAEATTDYNGNPALAFAMAPNQAKAFGEMTAANIGKAVEIVVCDEVLASPVILEAIYAGRGQITGAFTVEDMQDLARRINEADCDGFDAPLG